MTREKAIRLLANFYYTTCESIISMVDRNGIDPIELWNLVKSKGLIHKRDEFYRLFKYENTADMYWTKIWEERIDYMESHLEQKQIQEDLEKFVEIGYKVIITNERIRFIGKECFHIHLKEKEIYVNDTLGCIELYFLYVLCEDLGWYD